MEITFLSNGLGNTDEDFIFPGQCWRKGKEKKENGLHVQLRYEVLIHLLSQKQSTCLSAIPLFLQFDSRSPALIRTRYQVGSSSVLRCVSKVQVLELADIWVVGMTWYSPF